MSKRDGAAVQIDLLFAQAQELQVGERNNAESFVDLEGVNLLNLDVGVLQRLGDRERGCRRELRRFLCRVAPAEDAGQRGERVGFQKRFRHEEERRCAVGERRRVGCRHRPGAVGYECWLHGLKLFDIERHLGFFVQGDDGGRTFAAGGWDGDRGYFGREEAGFGGVLGFLDGANSVGILVSAGEGVIRGTFFGLEAHVVGRVGVCEPIPEDAVDECGIAEFGAGAQDGKVVGRIGHGFRPTGYDGGCIARHDGLGRQNDGF